MTNETHNTGGEDYQSIGCSFCSSHERVLWFAGEFNGTKRRHYGIELPMCLDCRDEFKSWIADQRQRCRDRQSSVTPTET